MVKNFIVACALVLVGSTSHAATEIAFADIAWGSAGEIVKARMLEHGFTFVRVDQEGDLQFNGTINGEPAGVVALQNGDGRLVKWLVTILPKEERALGYYRGLKQDLAARYGEAAIDREDWIFPYADGGHVGHEEIAIRAGKGVLKAAWATQRALPAVVIGMTDRLLVTAEYEGPGWNEEIDRRRAQPPARSSGGQR